MKRIITPALAASLMLALTACSGGGSANAAKLVPDEADFIGGVNLKALTSSKIYKDNKDKLEEEEDYKEMVEAGKECGIDIEKLDSITFGADSKEHVVIVIAGSGVGKKSNLECVAEKAKEKGEDDISFGERNGKKVVELEDDAVGYMINDNMLAIAHDDWADKVAELIDRKGKPAVDNSLKDVYGRAPTGKHLWIAGKVPSDMGDKLGPAEGAKDMTAGLDFSEGLAIEASAGFEDEDTAKSTTEKLQGEFDKVKGLAGMVGIPQSVVDSVEMKAEGNAMKVSAKATTEELEKIQKGIEDAMGGAMGGAPKP